MPADFNFNEFSEDDAVEFIKQRLPENLASALSDDDIFSIIDAAYDYYDKNGLLDLSDFDSEVDESKMAESIIEATGCQIKAEDIIKIVRLEEDYEDSLNDF